MMPHIYNDIEELFNVVATSIYDELLFKIVDDTETSSVEDRMSSFMIKDLFVDCVWPTEEPISNYL